MYSSTDDSGTPGEHRPHHLAVAGEEHLLHLAAGRAHDLAHVAGPLVLAAVAAVVPLLDR